MTQTLWNEDEYNVLRQKGYSAGYNIGYENRTLEIVSKHCLAVENGAIYVPILNNDKTLTPVEKRYRMRKNYDDVYVVSCREGYKKGLSEYMKAELTKSKEQLRLEQEKAKADSEILIGSSQEKATDVLNNIKLIDRKTYEALTDTEKSLYVRYNPSLSSTVYTQWLAQQNEFINYSNQLIPLIEKLSPLTGGSDTILEGQGPILDLLDLISSLVEETFSTLTSLIKTIQNTEIVDIVAEPLSIIAQMIGVLGGLIYAIWTYPIQNYKEYTQAFKDIDLASLKAHFTAEQTPNMEALNAQMATTVFPSAELKAQIDTQIAATKEIGYMIDTSIDSELAIKMATDTLVNTYDGIEKVLGSIVTLGLDVLTPDLKDLEDKMKMNYDKVKNTLVNENKIKKNAENMSKSVNKFIHNLPEEYIKIEDLDKLKELNEKLNDDKEEEKK